MDYETFKLGHSRIINVIIYNKQFLTLIYINRIQYHEGKEDMGISAHIKLNMTENNIKIKLTLE
jgi:hypothetical protein